MNSGRSDIIILVILTAVLIVGSVCGNVVLQIALMKYAWGIELRSLTALLVLSVLMGVLSGIVNVIVKALWKE